MNEDAGEVPAGHVEPEETVLLLDYEQFTRKNRPGLLRYARRIADSPEQGEDALQEALIEAYRMWPKVSAMERPLGWVLKVTKHKLSLLRRGRRRPPSAPLATDREPITDPAEAFVENSALWDAVRRLPPRLREVVSIRQTFDLDVSEIAALLDLKESTVRSHLTRSYARLRVLLADAQRDDVP